MAKRSKPEDTMIELPLESAERGGEVGFERVPEVDIEGLKEELDTVGETISNGQVSTSTQRVTAEVAEEEELDDGSFWALLLCDGYTSW